jgi:hypothetical protein
VFYFYWQEQGEGKFKIISLPDAIEAGLFDLILH